MEVPLPKKKTLTSRRTIDTDPNEITDDDRLFPYYFLIMMPNTVGTIAKACRRSDYPLAFLGVSIFVSFVLFECCLFKYLSLPKHEKSSQKFWLKLTMWFLYTAISFGLVHQFNYFFDLQMAVALYTVAMVCSAFLFYVFIIHDQVKNWMVRIHGEDEIKPLDQLDAGKLNYSDSVWERV